MSYGHGLKIRQPGGIKVVCKPLENAGSSTCPQCDCQIFNNWGAPQTILVGFGNHAFTATTSGSCASQCGLLNNALPAAPSPCDTYGQGPFTLTLLKGPCLHESGDAVYVPLQGLWLGAAYGSGGGDAPIGFLTDDCSLAGDVPCQAPPQWTDSARFCTWQSAVIDLNDPCYGTSGLGGTGVYLGFTLAYDPALPEWGICASLNLNGISGTTYFNWAYINLGQYLQCNFPGPDAAALPAAAFVAGQVGCALEIQANGRFELGQMIAAKNDADEFYFFEWQNWCDTSEGNCPSPNAFNVPAYPSCVCPDAPQGYDYGSHMNRPWQYLCFSCTGADMPNGCGPGEGQNAPARGVRGLADCTGASKTAPPCCCGSPEGAHKASGPDTFFGCIQCTDPSCPLCGVAFELTNNHPNGFTGNAGGVNVGLTHGSGGWTVSIDCGAGPTSYPLTASMGGSLTLTGSGAPPAGCCAGVSTISITISNKFPPAPCPYPPGGGPGATCLCTDGRPLPPQVLVTLPSGANTFPCGTPDSCELFQGSYLLDLTSFLCPGTETPICYYLWTGPIYGGCDTSCGPVGAANPACHVGGDLSLPLDNTAPCCPLSLRYLSRIELWPADCFGNPWRLFAYEYLYCCGGPGYFRWDGIAADCVSLLDGETVALAYAGGTCLFPSAEMELA